MRRVPWILGVALLAGMPRTAQADPEPRAIVERAVKAMGGLQALQKPIAVRTKFKGVFHFPDSDLKSASIEGESFDGGERTRGTIRVKLASTTREITIVHNRDLAWATVDGAAHEYSDSDKASWRILMHQQRVAKLTPLLTDKRFTLAPLPEARVVGRPATGVKVTYRGQPDTHLYFDKETGLLVKYAYRAKIYSDKAEVLHEEILSDYREPDLAAADEAILREAKSEVSGPALVAFLRGRTPSPEKLGRARALIPKLGDDAFPVRDQTSRDLVALGPVAIPFLREATKHDDREIARRARDCLRQIGEDSSKAQTAAAIRLLGLHKPAGAAEALLNYLPAADADVARELEASLFAIAQAAREPEPVLLRALDGKDPLRRRAAAAALGKDGGAYARQPGRRLFSPMPKRARKCQSLIDGKLDIEIEELDYQFFNAFEDKVFAKP